MAAGLHLLLHLLCTLQVSWEKLWWWVAPFEQGLTSLAVGLCYFALFRCACVCGQSFVDGQDPQVVGAGSGLLS